MKTNLTIRMMGSIGGVLLLQAVGSLVGAEDFFDRYQSLGKSVGVEKLTPQERSNLSSLIEGVAEISSSGVGNACENKSTHDCQLTYQECKHTCTDHSVFDYESGGYKRNTNLYDICVKTCRVVMNRCRQ